MPDLISEPTVVPAEGTPSKRIEEFVGRVNSGLSAFSPATVNRDG